MSVYPYHKEPPVLINVEITRISTLPARLKRKPHQYPLSEIRWDLINGVKIVFYAATSLILYILYWK